MISNLPRAEETRASLTAAVGSPVTLGTLATAHIPGLSIDVLVTIWEDGTGELAYRDGPEQHGLTWSPPIPLVNAP